MKLFYFKGQNGISNFGDDLNPWLWNQLLPNVLDNDKQTRFVGIGTLLNNYLPKARHTAIFSTGAGYGKSLPTIDDSWKIYCLRGPLSAKRLGVSDELAVTDGGLLIRRLFLPNSSNKVHKFAFMPHIRHASSAGTAWNCICQQLGFQYIDPRSPHPEVLTAISQTEVLLAEAMHGAIVADALRIPWIPIRTDATILAFKWLDWCLSVGLEYKPQYILPLWDLYPVGPGVRSSVRHGINWIKQDKLQSLPQLWGDKMQLMATQLERIAKTVQPTLSNDRRLEQLTQKLEEKLEHFKADVADGYFERSP